MGVTPACSTTAAALLPRLDPPMACIAKIFRACAHLLLLLTTARGRGGPDRGAPPPQHTLPQHTSHKDTATHNTATHITATHITAKDKSCAAPCPLGLGDQKVTKVKKAGRPFARSAVNKRGPKTRNRRQEEASFRFWGNWLQSAGKCSPRQAQADTHIFRRFPATGLCTSQGPLHLCAGYAQRNNYHNML